MSLLSGERRLRVLSALSDELRPKKVDIWVYPPSRVQGKGDHRAANVLKDICERWHNSSQISSTVALLNSDCKLIYGASNVHTHDVYCLVSLFDNTAFGKLVYQVRDSLQRTSE